MQDAATATEASVNGVYLNDDDSMQTAALGLVDTLDLTTGDVNGDSLVDIVLVNAIGAHQVYFGTGAFTAHPVLIVGTGAVAGTLGDVDGDGDRDLVLSNGQGGGSSVLMNQGDGSFGQPQARPPRPSGGGG